MVLGAAVAVDTPATSSMAAVAAATTKAITVLVTVVIKLS